MKTESGVTQLDEGHEFAGGAGCTGSSFLVSFLHETIEAANTISKTNFLMILTKL
jgi:hypothetical protein